MECDIFGPEEDHDQQQRMKRFAEETPGFALVLVVRAATDGVHRYTHDVMLSATVTDGMVHEAGVALSSTLRRLKDGN